MDGLTTQLQALGQLIGDLGPYVVLVILAFMYLRYTRQREHEQNNVAIVQAETQNAMSANQATLIQISEKTTQQFTLQSEKTNALIQQFIDFTTELKQVMATSNAAAQSNAAALTTFGERFASEITDMKRAVNAAGEQMTASRAATDNRLTAIQAGVEHADKVVVETKRVIDTLPADTNKVVLELGEKAANDHLMILKAADKLSEQIEQLPTYIVKAMIPVVDELKAAAQRLQDTESKLLETVRTIVPPREFAAESVPMNERSEAAIKDLKQEMGIA